MSSSYQDINILTYSNTDYIVTASQLSTYASGSMANLAFVGGYAKSANVVRITCRMPSGGGDSTKVFWRTIGY